MSEELTFGAKAVGLTFNPGQNPTVFDLKSAYAQLVDKLQGYRQSMGDTNPDVARMLSIAITEAQASQMWAVKAVTWPY